MQEKLEKMKEDIIQRSVEQKLTKVQEVSKVYNKRLQELMGKLRFNSRKPGLRIRNEADGDEEELRYTNGQRVVRSAETRKARAAEEDLLREPKQPNVGGREGREN